jgi:hypothetical protein
VEETHGWKGQKVLIEISLKKILPIPKNSTDTNNGKESCSDLGFKTGKQAFSDCPLSEQV